LKHLLVIRHLKKPSFTQAAARSYTTAVKSLGHDVAVRALYRLPFDPVLGEEELPDAAKPVIPSAVRREQCHVAAAGQDGADLHHFRCIDGGPEAQQTVARYAGP
jgi:NAD(P)H dehydrogenase (quinone)